MLALIDFDIFRYRYGFAAQRKLTDEVTEIDPPHTVALAINAGIKRIVQQTGADDYSGYLSGKNNFRLKIDPEYKANRKDMVKPFHYDFITNFLIQNHGAIVVDDKEADDILAEIQLESINNRILHKLPPTEFYTFRCNGQIRPYSYVHNYETIICSIDKDLDQIPGWHYDFVKDNKYYVTPEEAEYNFWLQVLTGDSVDNIPGIPGIGPVKARKILDASFEDFGSYQQKVEDAYKVYYKDTWDLHFWKCHDLVKLGVDLV